MPETLAKHALGGVPVTASQYGTGVASDGEIPLWYITALDDI